MQASTTMKILKLKKARTNKRNWSGRKYLLLQLFMSFFLFYHGRTEKQQNYKSLTIHSMCLTRANQAACCSDLPGFRQKAPKTTKPQHSQGTQHPWPSLIFLTTMAKMTTTYYKPRPAITAHRLFPNYTPFRRTHCRMLHLIVRLLSPSFWPC
jgi:hypothetical protein